MTPETGAARRADLGSSSQICDELGHRANPLNPKEWPEEPDPATELPGKFAGTYRARSSPKWHARTWSQICDQVNPLDPAQDGGFEEVR